LNLPAADKRRFVEEDKKRAKERLFHKINKKDNKYREEQEDLAQQWQKEIEKWEDQHMANYRRIYPGPDTAKYDKFYTQSGTLYSETAASKARLEQAKYIQLFLFKNQLTFLFRIHRAQIDELQKKQDKLNAFKNRKLYSGVGNNNPREMGGESPTRRPLPTIRSIRNSSMTRPIKRLTAVSFLYLSCFSLL
jgi:tubulin polyglutamylase TTLL6/13